MNPEANRAYQKAYREANPEKMKARHKAYYVANREAIKAYREANREALREQQKAYRKANREAIKARHKAYYVANREAFKAHYKANREAILARSKARVAANPKLDPCDECGAKYQRRRAARYCPMCRIARDDKRKVEEARGNAVTRALGLLCSTTRLVFEWAAGSLNATTPCVICRDAVWPIFGNSAHSATIEHLVPINLGGLHEWSNLGISHRGCNSSRGDSKTLEVTPGYALPPPSPADLKVMKRILISPSPTTPRPFPRLATR